MLPTTTDVLVVGAGPVGLATATTLAGQGVDVTIVDRLPLGENTSRAAVVHARTLEVLDTIGAAEPLVARGLPVSRFTIRDRDRVLVPVRFDELPTRYPYALMVPQSTTEAVLLDRLTELDGHVHRPYTVVDLDLDSGLATFEGGGTVRARYVVGADGMHSTVRGLAGIGFGGDSSAGQSFALADITVHSELPRDEVVLFFSRSGMVVWAPLPDGNVRVVAEAVDPPQYPGTEYVQSLLDARGPAGASSTVHKVVWGSRFRVHHRVADTFRAGPVLLAGDAGHVHSPAGGQGMNLGIQDGIALGNAIVEVLHGGPETILDGYAAARRPAAEDVVRFTHLLTRLATASAALRPARNTVMRTAAALPGFRRRLAWRLSGLVNR
jgi:2-polyprenyl-6-methoxyphenol hydroxylase-like FAD-dependent oxidoreductase